MGYKLRNLQDADTTTIVDIFNFYIEHSFAAFPEKKIPVGFFNKLKEMSTGYPFYVVENENTTMVGFGFLHPFRPMTVFHRTAEVTYFISPDQRRKGAGKTLLNRLIEDGRKTGLDSLVATISSKNTESIAFHTKNEFRECGRIVKAGKKFGEDFDIIIMQRILSE